MPFEIVSDRAASICALLAIACLAAWPLFRSRDTMLAIQLVALAALSLHYALLGSTTAASVNTLGAMQIAASLLFGTHPRLRGAGYVLAAAMVVASVITWQGRLSALAVIGNVLVTIGRVQTNANTMRLIVLSGGPFWFAHDIMLASPIAIADALSLAAGIGGPAWRRMKGLLPYWRRPHPPSAQST